MIIIVVLIIIYGYIKKVPVFDCFLIGVKDGFKTVYSIAPALIALITAISMLQASGFLNFVSNLIAPVTNIFSIPSEIIPLALMRPISGSGSTAILNNIFSAYGTDTNIGQIASILAGASETTFYAIAVYYGAIGIKNTSYTIPAALSSDFASMVMACICVNFLPSF